jgi:hypothetical protein
MYVYNLVGVEVRTASIIRVTRQYSPLKRRSTPARLHGAISQEPLIFILHTFTDFYNHACEAFVMAVQNEVNNGSILTQTVT